MSSLNPRHNNIQTTRRWTGRIDKVNLVSSVVAHPRKGLGSKTDDMRSVRIPVGYDGMVASAKKSVKYRATHRYKPNNKSVRSNSDPESRRTDSDFRGDDRNSHGTAKYRNRNCRSVYNSGAPPKPFIHNYLGNNIPPVYHPVSPAFNFVPAGDRTSNSACITQVQSPPYTAVSPALISSNATSHMTDCSGVPSLASCRELRYVETVPKSVFSPVCYNMYADRISSHNVGNPRHRTAPVAEENDFYGSKVDHTLCRHVTSYVKDDAEAQRQDSPCNIPSSTMQSLKKAFVRTMQKEKLRKECHKTVTKLSRSGKISRIRGAMQNSRNNRTLYDPSMSAYSVDCDPRYLGCDVGYEPLQEDHAIVETHRSW